MVEKDSLISARDAAKRLGISRPTLSRLIRDKRIAVYRCGVRTLFDEKILADYKSSIFQPARKDAPRPQRPTETT